MAPEQKSRQLTGITALGVRQGVTLEEISRLDSAPPA
jgi:hypothetical protein